MSVVKSKMVPTLETLKLMIKIKKMTTQQFIELYNTPLLEWFEKENISPKLRKFLTMISSTLQVNPFPERSSAGELIHNVHRVLEIGSVYYPRGGWSSIFNNFIEKITENKSEVRLDKKVSKIIVESSKARGVIVDDNVIEAENVISTIPIQEIFSILDENLCKKDFIERCKNLRPTAGVSIDFCLSKPISKLNGIIFFDNPFSFGFIPSNLSTEVAPKGQSLMTFFTPTNVEDIKDKSKMTKIHQRLRDIVL